MTSTLNALIEAAVLGSEAIEKTASASVEVQAETSVETSTDPSETEKIAAALEFIGRRGIASFMPKEAMAVETNAGKRPGGGKAQADLSSTEKGTHCGELSSSASAIAYDKKVKAKRTSPALKKVLKAAPFADDTLKKNLTNAAGKGDKNINKTAHDLEAIRLELERRAAEGVA